MTVARTYHTHQVHYFRHQLAFGSIATPTHSVSRHFLGKLPAGAQILFLSTIVKTGFSAAGTRVLTVGSNGTTANNMQATVTEETITSLMNIALSPKLTFSSDTDVFVKMTTAGTAAAAGLVENVLAFVLPVPAN
jgi:hypothetical protein